MIGSHPMSQHAAVLFANDAFYLAFRTRDLEAMAAVWSEREGITCIHPGWRPLSGRQPVMTSWRAILSNPDNPEVECRGAEAHTAGDVAYVLCYEVMPQGLLVATNIFVHEGGIWRMIHHQSGPAPASSADDDGEDEPLARVQ